MYTSVYIQKKTIIKEGVRCGVYERYCECSEDGLIEV